ncbi:MULTISPECIES: hypothetical protein [unclassified Microcoleus]|uniref:hypothetical protein n=1 Tax=unclassified Microcoleus TaxID=2642155 RepID=UPI002FD132D3
METVEVEYLGIFNRRCRSLNVGAMTVWLWTQAIATKATRFLIPFEKAEPHKYFSNLKSKI